MATIDVAPRVLKDIELTIGLDDYRKHVDQVTLTPTYPSVSWTGLGANTHKDVGTPSWVAALNYAQDWDTPNSLSRYLLANAGQQVTMTFRPRSGIGPSYTATVILAAGPIGGQVNAFATSSVSLEIVGTPTLVEAGATPTILAAIPSGAAAGALVTIAGSRFTGVTGVTGVKFAAVNASSYVVLADGTIVATVPAGTAGAAAITVTNGAGASAAFAYTRG